MNISPFLILAGGLVAYMVLSGEKAQPQQVIIRETAPAPAPMNGGGAAPGTSQKFSWSDVLVKAIEGGTQVALAYNNTQKK